MTLNRREEDFLNHDKNPHFGATCGRVAGRIANAKFTLPNGSSHEILANNGPHALHGGEKGYSRINWEKV
jgi:aldose 1-epimerase